MDKMLICKAYDMGDCEGFEALKTIATTSDQKILDKLIKESWKVCDGTHKNEDKYHNEKHNIFKKYGFIFKYGDCIGYDGIIYRI